MSTLNALEEKIKGAICPLPGPLARRFFEGKDVLVKFAGGRYRFLRKGHTLQLYDSDIRRIVGDGQIVDIFSTDDLDSVWEKYSNRIFLTKKEFQSYSKHAPWGTRKWRTRKPSVSVFVLDKIRLYQEPTRLNRRMTPNLLYIRG